MDTPIADFLARYAASGTVRFHMPGHKGSPVVGCEPLDITEITGADALYEAEGIIAQSEKNASALFDSGRTLYATEGSSQCIRAMVYLAVTRERGERVIVAGRNVHKALLYAAALTDARIVWLWPEKRESLCACSVAPETLRRTLERLSRPPAAVYLTSPDYLGGRADLPALAEICRAFHTPLLVDNAHGAYLRFLEGERHPLEQGADLCCDSAHKTLPVLTGGAYLHVGKGAPPEFAVQAKDAMALFGSTSPSYLTLASLDRCNGLLAEGYGARIARTAERLREVREQLRRRGWAVEDSDPLRLTLRGDTAQMRKRLREGNIEWEYADRDYLVLMATPENSDNDFARLVDALGENEAAAPPLPALPLCRGKPVLTPRQALFAPHERIPVGAALGRICGAPTVSCPPAVPIAVSGERIGREALELFAYYHMQEVDVVRE